MESEIIVKIKPRDIIELFERSDLINIRFYEPEEGQFIGRSHFDIPTNYRFRIRHNEDEDPREKLSEALEILTK